ncbi:MAG: efflux RND transporter periplasmic adaptor subunit [Hyphomicrobiales bacterium]|nr:efflux RND transporter periplasmic adaptor subunit [Hyphomicrobiales bacterium]
MLMRNEDNQEASFVQSEAFVGEGHATGSAANASPSSSRDEEASTKPASRPARRVLAAFSYSLSAVVVLAAFGYLLAVGLSGRFSSAAQVQGDRAATGTSVQTASLETAAKDQPVPAPPVQAVPVLTSLSEKRPAPITADAVGRVESMASITVRTRVDGQIAKVMFRDGQAVRQGDVLYELDARQIDAQIRQAEAVVAKDRSQIVQTQRDLVRNDTLARTNAGSILNLQNAQTADALAQANLLADEAALDNLRVQRSYYTITSPVSGRVGIGLQREGSAIRTGDASGTLVTVNQIRPIYVNFSLPQKLFSSLQSVNARGGAPVVATVQGSEVSAEGKVAAIDNSVDSSSGNIGVRALFDNPDEGLWPGLLCNVTVTLGHDEETVVVPRNAVQSSQDGNIVFVVEHGAAKVKSVTVDRFEGATAVISSGLRGGETVVTDGQLRLTDGTPVTTLEDKRRGGG